MVDQKIVEKVRKLIAEAFSCDEVMKEHKITQENIDTLRRRSLSSDYVPKGIIDKILLMILVACDNDMEKSVLLLHNYCKYVKKTPEFFAKRDVTSKEVQSSLDSHYYISLPPTPNNCNLFFYRLLNCDPKYHNFNDAEKTYLMTIGAQTIFIEFHLFKFF